MWVLLCVMGVEEMCRVVGTFFHFLGMSSGSVGWYYLENKIWTAFDSAIASELENFIQKGDGGQLSDFTVNFKEMVMTKRERGAKRKKIAIKRANMHANPSFSWEWEMNGTWHEYDFFDSDFIDLVESKPYLGYSVLYLGPDNTPYQIDPINLSQRNVKTSFRRSIRKLPVAMPPAPVPSSSSAAPPPNPLQTSNPPQNSTLPSIDLSGVPPFISGVLVGCTQIDCSDDCVICMEPFDDDNGLAHCLPGCSNHGFHLECIKNQLLNQGKCPICNKIYVINEGTQPKNGSMTVRSHPRGSLPLPGYSSYGTIEINYHFPSGVQGPEHPHPGTRYSGTSRTAYLPDCPEGQEVLELFKKCFEKRLIFTVGRSITTGQDNCVVWNGVHHKTNVSGGPSHFGYPDDTYLTRVKEELAAKGFS